MSVSFLPVWLNFSAWELLTDSCLLLTLITLLSLNPKPIFKLVFCYTPFYLQRTYTKASFPCTYSKQKKTGSFIPKPLLTPSLSGLCSSDWASSRERTVLGCTATMCISQDPDLRTAGGWKGVRKNATFACPALLVFHRPQHLLGTKYWAGMLRPS